MPLRLAPAKWTVLLALALGLLAAPLCAPAWAQDRYGPTPPIDPSDQAYSPSGPFLYWPGKPQAQPQAPAEAPPQDAPSAPAHPSIFGPPPRATRPTRAVSRAPAQAQLRGAYGISGAAAPAWSPPAQPMRQARAAQSEPIQAEPAQAQAQVAAAAPAAQGGLPPRFYSVQREYGGEGLPAQFFADSAQTDMAAPPPPPAPPVLAGQASTASTAAAIRQREAEAEASDNGDTPDN